MNSLSDWPTHLSSTEFIVKSNLGELKKQLVGIWSLWHSGGPVMRGLNTRGCEVPGRNTHQLVISNHWKNKEELPAEVDCGIIANHCDSLIVVVVVTI